MPVLLPAVPPSDDVHDGGVVGDRAAAVERRREVHRDLPVARDDSAVEPARRAPRPTPRARRRRRRRARRAADRGAGAAGAAPHQGVHDPPAPVRGVGRGRRGRCAHGVGLYGTATLSGGIVGGGDVDGTATTCTVVLGRLGDGIGLYCTVGRSAVVGEVIGAVVVGVVITTRTVVVVVGQRAWSTVGRGLMAAAASVAGPVASARRSSSARSTHRTTTAR